MFLVPLLLLAALIVGDARAQTVVVESQQVGERFDGRHSDLFIASPTFWMSYQDNEPTWRLVGGETSPVCNLEAPDIAADLKSDRDRFPMQFLRVGDPRFPLPAIERFYSMLSSAPPGGQSCVVWGSKASTLWMLVASGTVSQPNVAHLYLGSRDRSAYAIATFERPDEGSGVSPLSKLATFLATRPDIRFAEVLAFGPRGLIARDDRGRVLCLLVNPVELVVGLLALPPLDRWPVFVAQQKEFEATLYRYGASRLRSEEGLKEMLAGAVMSRARWSQMTRQDPQIVIRQWSNNAP